MKSKNSKQKLFPAFVGVALVMLQSCLFLHGCSLPAENIDSEAAQRSLYSSKCASCHQLIPPEKHSPDVWREYVYKYGKAMPQQQKQTLIDYLQYHSREMQ